MKITIKLLGIACVMFGLLFTSCSGEDGDNGATGAQGVQGEQGIDGIQGAVGADGTGADGADGADGNNNVTVTNYELGLTADYFMDIPISEVAFMRFDATFDTAPFLEAGNTDNDIVLYYVVTGGVSIPVPGTFDTSDFFAFMEADNIIHLNINPPLSLASASKLDSFKVVMIKSTVAGGTLNTAGKGSNGGKAAVLSELKQAGVDVNDYEAVVSYYAKK